MSYYVYLLTDPRNNNQVFYCGKGKGDRWKSHLGHWSGNGKNNPTENKVKKIQAEGLQPGVIFLHQGIECEKEAYQLEEEYIKQHFDQLTNTKISARPPNVKGKASWNKGKKLSSNHKEAISSGMRGHKRGSYSLEHRQAISESLKGDKHPNFGKPAIQRTSIVEIKSGRIFESQTEAAKILNIRQGDIANCLKGRQKTVKGYIFEYAENIK